MSFGWTAATWMAVTAGATAAATLYTGQQARKQQRDAMAESKRQAESQQLAADEAQNKANAKAPDVTALMSANLMASQAGNGGTMLTGPGGIDPDKLKLGRASLLGGG